MRRAEFERSIEKLVKQHSGKKPDVRSLPPGVDIDLAKPCVVLGGRNGVGKSRLLRSIAEQDHTNGIYIDLHLLAEHALASLRSRTDIDAMREEYTPPDLSTDTRSAVSLIVGREYASINWYSFELEPPDALVASRFKWGGEQSLVPYFVVEHRGLTYDALDMGLGEFCVHFLFWIIDQYRDSHSITLLLDEPDAYLPPVGVSTLMHHLADTCLKNEWKIVISTHSEEMIRIARDNSFFTLLRVDDTGNTKAVHSSDDPSAGDMLLSPSGVELLLFCEDESATNLTRAILQLNRLDSLRHTSIVWGDGDGYLRRLHRAMPKPPSPDIRFAYIFDGDQRAKPPEATSRQWPAVFLPTDDDPDSLFKALTSYPNEMASSLGVPVGQLVEFLDTVIAEDPHDWVNTLGTRFGRTHTLSSLSSLWCRLHPAEVDRFITDLEATQLAK